MSLHSVLRDKEIGCHRDACQIRNWVWIQGRMQSNKEIYLSPSFPLPLPFFCFYDLLVNNTMIACAGLGSRIPADVSCLMLSKSTTGKGTNSLLEYTMCRLGGERVTKRKENGVNKGSIDDLA